MKKKLRYEKRIGRKSRYRAEPLGSSTPSSELPSTPSKYARIIAAIEANRKTPCPMTMRRLSEIFRCAPSTMYQTWSRHRKGYPTVPLSRSHGPVSVTARDGCVTCCVPSSAMRRAGFLGEKIRFDATPGRIVISAAGDNAKGSAI